MTIDKLRDQTKVQKREEDSRSRDCPRSRRGGCTISHTATARPWCKHCVHGAAAEYPHRTVVGEAGESVVPRVMLDYCFLKESAIRSADERTDKEEATVSLTALGLKETMGDSVWATR